MAAIDDSVITKQSLAYPKFKLVTVTTVTVTYIVMAMHPIVGKQAVVGSEFWKTKRWQTICPTSLVNFG